MDKHQPLTGAWGWLLFAYTLAIAVMAAFTWALSGYHPLIALGVGDLAATVVMFVFSRSFNNSSFYDPYWSVIPLFIGIGFWAMLGSMHLSLRQVLVFILLAVWGIRLTWNFMRGWHGLSHQDWRYTMLKRKTGKWYWLVSFLGIHLFPTTLVYMGCFCLYAIFAESSVDIHAIDIIGLIVAVVAIVIEARADEELLSFRKANINPGETLDTGLWSLSRHPNYFGETLFWWGLWIFGMAVNPNAWWTIAGPIGMTILFLFISIPMIEKRMLERRDDYASYQARVSAFIPWFPTKKESILEQEPTLHP